MLSKSFHLFLKVEFNFLQEFFVCRPRSDLENIEAFEEKRKQIWVEEKKGWCFLNFETFLRILNHFFEYKI